jgi:hypothetical protein
MNDLTETMRVTLAIATQFRSQMDSTRDDAAVTKVTDRNFHRLFWGANELPERAPRQWHGFEAYVGRLFQGLMEIRHSQERMKDVETYLRVFPFPKRLNLSKSGYLGFVVEAYIQELYLLKERLKRFSTMIERAWRKNRSAKKVASACKHLRDIAEGSMVGAVKARGNHVHGDARFDDTQLEHLRFLETTLHLLQQFPPTTAQELAYESTAKMLYRRAHANAKREWVAKVHANNAGCEHLIEAACKLLRPVIVMADGTLGDPFL